MVAMEIFFHIDIAKSLLWNERTCMNPIYYTERANVDFSYMENVWMEEQYFTHCLPIVIRKQKKPRV